MSRGARGSRLAGKCETEGSSGYVYDNKGGQVSGVRAGIGDGLQNQWESAAGKSAKMKVHPVMLMKIKKCLAGGRALSTGRSDGRSGFDLKRC
jgi:hypothetical protein